MFFYKVKDSILFSKLKFHELNIIDETEAKKNNGSLYYLTSNDPLVSRRSFAVSDTSLLSLQSEGINLLKSDNSDTSSIPNWILSKINQRKVTSVNTQYPNWKEVLNSTNSKKWRVNIVGLGDVGGTLLTGLRLLGGTDIEKLGIYARSENTINRWTYEMNQVLPAFSNDSYPPIVGVLKEDLFDCDMFIFCASKGVPPVGSNTKDVRMVQFEGNSQIIKDYANLARKNNFKGIFAVVSDPVDLLSKVVFLESNRNENGTLDFKGLAPEQVRGYGLGVMNARATYYSQLDKDTISYSKEGRAFGPHGEGLIIANSILNYDDELSQILTKQTKEANIEVRKTGYKPYIAPALSSGTFSILATIRGQWHYSATFMGGVFIGAKNRLTQAGIELERLDLPEPLLGRLNNTYEMLGDII